MLSYIGGKSKIGKWINEFFPKNIETYVEPFGGMFWCYYNMDIDSYSKLKRVVYNDFNPLNYNLFLCLQNVSVLYSALDRIPVQTLGVDKTPGEYKDLFKSFQKEIFQENFKINYPDYDVAAKYVYIVTQVFSGSKPETASYIDLKGKYKSKYITFKDKLKKDKWVKYFNKITHFRNGDFQNVIDEFDSETTYIYLDPPYWKTENYYSNHDFDVSDHRRLADLLSVVKGKFGLSYYYFTELSELYPKDKFTWHSKSFAKAAGAKKGIKQNQVNELLITNY